MDDNFFTEKELRNANRGSIAPVVVVIFVIIALLGLAFFGGKYYLASRNNIKIFMNDYFNELEENIGKNNSTSGSLSLNVNGDTTDKEEKIFKILNNLDFSMNYGIDTKENITNIDISTNYYGDKLININTYIEDNNIYLSSSDLYSKYIKIENKKEDNSEKKSMTNDDYKIIINSISTAVSESLKEEYFTKNWVKLDPKNKNCFDAVAIDSFDGDVIFNIKMQVFLIEIPENMSYCVDLERVANNMGCIESVNFNNGNCNGKLICGEGIDGTCEYIFVSKGRRGVYDLRVMVDKYLEPIYEDIIDHIIYSFDIIDKI